MSGWQLARPDILALKAYRPAEQLPGAIRLNANEAPAPLRSDLDQISLNRYPDVHPTKLADRMSALFGVSAEQLLVTRGSSEAIDVLIRSFCRAYEHNVVTLSPSFEMYRFYADVQGVAIKTLALDPAQDFAIGTADVLALCDDETRLVILCSPNNPTGTLICQEDVLTITAALRGRAIVIVDEAYVEFSDQASLALQAAATDNLVVLRTLSKAHALAGARCGAAIATPEIIDVLRCVLPPYSFPTPVIASVLQILENEGAEDADIAIERIVAERQRLSEELAKHSLIEKIWPSQANFVLVRCRRFDEVMTHLKSRRILVRDFSDEAQLAGCARITVGTREETDVLLRALGDFENGA